MKFYNLGHKTFETDFRSDRCHQLLCIKKVKLEKSSWGTLKH